MEAEWDPQLSSGHEYPSSFAPLFTKNHPVVEQVKEVSEKWVTKFANFVTHSIQLLVNKQRLLFTHKP